MYRWNNDYSRNCHPAVLKALQETSGQSFGGYGIDGACEEAARLIRDLARCPDADVHFVAGGTQANVCVISAALRPWESPLCADSGHINCHETGALEHCGHKILTVPGHEGKLTARQVEQAAEDFRRSEIPEHVTRPKLVYISCPTEFGTIYSRAELEELRKVCSRYGLYLYLDGARLGYGLGSPDCDFSLADLSRLTDAFYIGGTKCGALFGEAVVLVNPDLKPMFRSVIKQNCSMLAKGWLLGLQFSALLGSGAWFDGCRQGVAQAMRIRSAFQSAGVPFYATVQTNQMFVILTREQADFLSRNHVYELQERMPDGRLCLRFCTSWATTDQEADALIRDIETMPGTP